MKLERLLSIIILLLNRRMVQAKELAERFEVSVRTIYRDIEAINGAGIPIVTYQGTNGGIGLAEGYRLDRNVLTNDELAAIFTALRSISTSYGNEQHRHLMEKINSVVPPQYSEEFQHKTSRVLIDYSPWDGNERLRPKLQLLKEAVDSCRIAGFIYSNAEGVVSHRIVEPHMLIMKGRQWYLKAYCQTKEQFRLFKLKRMKELEIAPERTFIRRELPMQERTTGQSPRNSSRATEFVLRFQADSRHLAEEWFGIEELVPLDDGSWQVRKAYPEDEWLYRFILGLGHHAEVLEPPHLREIIASRAEQAAKIYRIDKAT
ncbi:Predicted DNA-binding transcriptional regulator YafY, contains an HTH and WYL domains [Paenibacillus algorifonticola]|uniref:Predicted DNA-binding transcriptional regulator YafY, contains an HTH and WYL domains n=1 Tax=Paenibacillus algorifonticola TaxID=684063 RepID=A0A1I2H810_9BACL|nr:YafY family protein [Paenibacillus algorifonticola]SFF26334.1 Predicted DNA-binding transcriptional regulator YafY, contains an HTH and WYL domains [Paenibacillus algorifonticola]